MFCSNCGKQLPDHSKFCTGCGTSLVPAASQPPANPPVPHPPVRVNAAAPATEPVRKKSGMRTVTLVLVIVLIVSLLAVIGVFGYMLLSEFAFNNSGDAPSMEIPEYMAETDDPFAGLDITVPEGNPVPKGNLYRDCYNDTTGFVLYNSHKQYYSRSDLTGLNELELVIAVNEIYARRGQTFDNADLQEYFDSMSWYQSGSASGSLNSFEQANLVLLDVFQRDLDGSLYRSSNPYLDYQNGSNAEFLSGSDSRYLHADDLEDLTKNALVLARNEIYARRGYVFSDVELQEYFYCKQWYTPSTTFIEGNMNDWETANLELIQVYEKILDGGYTPAYDNPYIPHYSYYNEYILPDGSSRLLDEYDLMGYSLEELIIARNQIIARHGYTFKDQELMEYFLQCSWYRPSTAPGRNDLVSLSTTEAKNMNFIADYEKILKSKPDLSSLNTALNEYVETAYYSLYIPEYWDDYSVISESSGSSSHFLTFYEKKSYDATGGSGLLFRIEILPTTEEYSYLPQYEELGSITDANGNGWNVIVYYPSDVQFHDTYMELYTKMYAEIDRILDTLQFKDSYTFSYSMLPIG